MKKSHKRIFIYELIVILFLMINSFTLNIFNNYGMVLFLLILMIIFKLFFGYEKDRHRYIKDILFDLIIFLLTFFLIFYLSGIIFSFAKTDNYWNINDFVNIIFPIVLSIIMKEYLRYQTLTKSEGSILLIITSIILFILLDITTSIYYVQGLELYDVFLFIALSLLPSISTNVVCSYITSKVGYKPMIFYRLVMELYLYLLPLVPNPNPYIMSIIRLILPLVFGYKVFCFFRKERDDDVTISRKKMQLVFLVIPSIFITFVVYITSGYFHYHAIAIASGSMTPTIRKGDVVIIEKIDKDYDKLDGKVIAYEYDGIIVVHRLVGKLKVNNEFYYFTKGDANVNRDNYYITEDMIIGVVNVKVPYIGLPTVWLNEL